LVLPVHLVAVRTLKEMPMHMDDVNKYEGPPCKLCTDSMFVGTCTHRMAKIPAEVICPIRELKDLAAVARRFCQEHRNVEKNPEKLLAADKKGAEECTRVSHECGESMKVYQEALTNLTEVSRYFFALCTSLPGELREALPRDLEIGFAAARFVLAQCEFDLVPSSLKYRSRGPLGPEGERYFKLRQELVDIAERA